MRIDTHVHMYDEETLAELKGVVRQLDITHYVAIMRPAAYHLADRLDDVGARGIPFLWIEPTEPIPEMDLPVAGYKIHPRQSRMPDGRQFQCTPARLAGACDLAARSHRPLLFHTDGDEPGAGSVPMLAEVARRFPQTTIIAGHMGVYTQEFVGNPYTPESWEPRVEPLFRTSLELILRTPNLYGDITKFGMDFPARTHDPMHRLKVFKEVVRSMPWADRAALSRKLFTGSDFPCFWDPEAEENASLKGMDFVRRSHLAFQVECMAEAFGDAFDEEATARAFLALLPEEFRIR